MDGKHLHRIGCLSLEEAHTPDGKYMADSETFVYFRMRDWYVVAPFVEWDNLEGGGYPRKVPRANLHATDFKADLTLLPSFDSARYQKSRGEHQKLMARLAQSRTRR